MSNLAQSFAPCQAPLFYMCLRCQTPIISEISPYMGICGKCWDEWIKVCAATANKFDWLPFLRREKPPPPRPSCFQCYQYQLLCKDCLYGRRPR